MSGVAQQSLFAAIEADQSSFLSFLSCVLTASCGTMLNVRLHSRCDVRERTGPAVADQSEGGVLTQTPVFTLTHTP